MGDQSPNPASLSMVTASPAAQIRSAVATAGAPLAGGGVVAGSIAYTVSDEGMGNIRTTL